jgi:hypothetical protein
VANADDIAAKAVDEASAQLPEPHTTASIAPATPLMKYAASPSRDSASLLLPESKGSPGILFPAGWNVPLRLQSNSVNADYVALPFRNYSLMRFEHFWIARSVPFG